MSDENVEALENEEDLPGGEAEETPEPPKSPSTYIDFDKWDQVKPEQVRARIDLDTREKREFERKAKEYERKVKEYEDKLREYEKPKEVKPPPVDLAYENQEEYARQNQAYVESQRKQAEWEAKEAARQAQTKAQQEQEHAKRIGDFVSRGSKAGLDQAKLVYAAQIVVPQLNEQLQDFITDHDYGPQILDKLANNPMEVSELANLNPIQAGLKLDRMAEAFKRSRKSNAPPPDDPIQGSGLSRQERGPKGARFE